MRPHTRQTFLIEIVRLRRSKARKKSRQNARRCGKFCLILAHRPRQTRPARTACAAQHARRQCSSRPSLRCIWHRDCAIPAFESAQKFARKRASVWQILFDFGAPPMQNSAGVHRVRCATRLLSANFVFESALHLLPRLRDFGVRKRAKIRDQTRDGVANFV